MGLGYGFSLNLQNTKSPSISFFFKRQSYFLSSGHLYASAYSGLPVIEERSTKTTNGFSSRARNTIFKASSRARTSSGVTIDSGQEVMINIIVRLQDVNYSFSSGTTLNMKLHSAGGMDYIKLVELV